MALETALIIYMLKRAWLAYVKCRRHETRGLPREERVVLKGGSALRSVDERTLQQGELLLLLPPGVLSSVVRHRPKPAGIPFIVTLY